MNLKFKILQLTSLFLNYMLLFKNPSSLVFIFEFSGYKTKKASRYKALLKKHILLFIRELHFGKYLKTFSILVLPQLFLLQIYIYISIYINMDIYIYIHIYIFIYMDIYIYIYIYIYISYFFCINVLKQKL